MSPKPWAEFQEEVLALYAPPIRRKSTERKMYMTLKEFGALCPSTADLNPAVVARWVAAHSGRRPATVDSILRQLRAACTYGEGRGYLVSPFAFRKPSQWVDWDAPELEPPVHTAEEMAAVLRLADREASSAASVCDGWKARRLRALVYTYAFTGARKREILGMKVEDIALEASVLVLRTNARRPLKTPKSAARLPIPAPLGEVLAAWLPETGSDWAFPGVTRRVPWLGGPPGDKALDQVEALGRRAGVKRLTIASFRHTFATLSEGWGIGELLLQRILRHTTVRTQKRYRHELPENLRQAASLVHY